MLKESYISNDYKKEECPFYEYFYYADYLNEKYINEKLENMDDGMYPVLKQYFLSKIEKLIEIISSIIIYYYIF